MNLLAIALPFEFQQPVWLWVCVLVPILVIVSLKSLSGLEPARRTLAVAVRSALVILVACCLAGIVRVQRNDDLTVMFLMDRSFSVQSQQKYQEQFIREASADIPPNDQVGLIDFSRHSEVRQLPMRGGYYIEPGRLPVMPNTERTNIASAMRRAMAMFPHDTAKRMVLLSDGNDNMGDVIAEAKRAAADRIPIDVVPLWYEHRNEIFFERMIAPTYAEPGELLPIRMVVHSHKKADGTIMIYQNGNPVMVGKQATHVTLQPGSNTFFVKLPVDSPGAQTFEAVFHPDDESMDAIALNNSAGAFTFVSGKSTALLISGNRLHDQPLYEALRRENVNVDLKTPDELGEFGLLQMMNYATIILANVPAASFTDQQLEAMASYVKDMGSGLIMTGGDESFGAGGWIGTPIEEIMPVSFEVKHKRVIPRGALVLIMHSCEIARGNYYGKEMAKKSVDTISSQDYLGVITYTYSPGGENWEVPLDLNTNKAAVKAKIDRMQMGDMPSFAASMGMAYKELTNGRGKDAAQKHVIILSDGDAQPPSTRQLNDFKREKITVSTIGIGWGAHSEQTTMRRIARATDGKYYLAKNPRALPQIFVKESKVVRRPLIVDSPFQPRILHDYSELLAGLDVGAGVPQLGGLILSSPKESQNVVIPLIRATDDGKDPVLAHWQYELGKTVAFTSGYWPIWGESWVGWSAYAKLWAQIVRWTMRQETPANFDTYTKIEGNRGRIVIDALDKDAGYLNLLQLRARAIGPDNKPTTVEFRQTGPGHYEAEIQIEKSGQYLANVQILDGVGGNLGTIRTGFSVPFSPEYRDLRANEALLRQIADTTGGRWIDGDAKEADLFSHDLPPTEAKRPAWAWVLAWLLLPLFLLDVAARRLASWLALSIVVELVLLIVLLFGAELRYGPWWGILGAFLLAELVGWTIRFRYIGPLFDFMTHTVTALGQTGDRSAVALDKLKSKRDEVREDLAAGKSGKSAAASTETPDVSPKIAKRRYDVGDAQAAKPAQDLGDALGGAEASSETAKPARPPAGKKDGEEEGGQGTMSQLLRAKKRADRDRKDKK